MNKDAIEFTTEETKAIVLLIAIKKIGHPVPSDFELPMTLVSKGFASVSDLGEPHITNDQEWRLMSMGVHPSQRR